jgi:hypothetical protein
MAYTYSKLATYTVGSGGISSVSFLNIPQDYTDLLIKASPDSTYTGGSYGDGLYVSYNNDTTSTNYNNRYFYAYDSASGSGAQNLNSVALYPDDAATMTNNVFGNLDVYIPNYSSVYTKTSSIDFASEVNSTTNWVTGFFSSTWNKPDPITSIILAPIATYVFKQYSTFHLYGIKAEL